jgi:hypothetical protein
MKFKSITTALALVISASVTAQTPAPLANVPDNLKAGANESVAIVVAAKGVQIYECRKAKDQTDTYEWALVGPEAELFDASGKKVGTHYAGPHWEAADGSKIVGIVKARADAPRTGAIPWLLLTARSVGGPGSLSKITAVQRLNTSGGVPPEAGCSQSTAGSIVRSPYTADYYFLTTESARSSTIDATANLAAAPAGIPLIARRRPVRDYAP